MNEPWRLCFEDRTRRRTFDMYRIIIALVCFTNVSPAPQDSNVTFVKIQPYISDEILNPEPERLPIFKTNETRPTAPTLEQTNTTFETNDFNRHDDDVTTEADRTTTETAEATTDYDTTTTPPTTKRPKLKKKQNPRFLSKSSHFKRANSINRSTNSINSFVKVERPHKRKFKSRCRCEKIENCPKLQITVPRCPNDYFLCCF